MIKKMSFDYTGVFCAFILLKQLEINFRICFLQATVGFTLFGKESLVDIDLSEIVPETN